MRVEASRFGISADRFRVVEPVSQPQPLIKVFLGKAIPGGYTVVQVPQVTVKRNIRLCGWLTGVSSLGNWDDGKTTENKENKGRKAAMAMQGFHGFDPHNSRHTGPHHKVRE
ncbi:MAG: hypothetical protein KGJ17_00630 [Gammaproteobacteria bacterium]|nr:hypothetical protein [Gammaproteobacteria bacterium]MDE2138987.1 hypothetical protein [Gammaproteobacteria bacterium]